MVIESEKNYLKKFGACKHSKYEILKNLIQMGENKINLPDLNLSAIIEFNNNFIICKLLFLNEKPHLNNNKLPKYSGRAKTTTNHCLKNI